jgi:HAD superfamily hydrolase (TIGR01509 family)
MPDAVIWDLDGVLLDSEALWDAARRAVAAEAGGHWSGEATVALQGMSAPEWSAYLRDELDVAMAPAEISRAVVARVIEGYRARLPLLPGAVEAVRALAKHWPLGLASSANKAVIEVALALAGLTGAFGIALSSEEVARGKPAPDVYLEAARRLEVAPDRCVAIEDSSNGLRSAAAAGLRVIAVPNRSYSPTADALALAAAVVGQVREVTPELVGSL